MTMRSGYARPYEASDLVLRETLDPIGGRTWELYPPGTDESSIDEGVANWLVAGSGDCTLDDRHEAFRDWLIQAYGRWPL